MTLKIDTHQHFWNLSKTEYSWLTPAYGPIYKTFAPQDLEPQLRAAGIDRTVLVQSANSNEDTVSMLTQAECYDWIGGVVGWAPLYDHAEAARLLDRYSKHPKWRGVRHLNHDEPESARHDLRRGGDFPKTHRPRADNRGTRAEFEDHH
jgi:L-fuconolactonase